MLMESDDKKPFLPGIFNDMMRRSMARQESRVCLAIVFKDTVHLLPARIENLIRLRRYSHLKRRSPWAPFFS
jgi:hypothetical protein